MDYQLFHSVLQVINGHRINMRFKVLQLLMVLSVVGCSAEVNLAKTVLTGDSHSQSWQQHLIEMRRKYEVYIGKTTDDLLTEMGKPSAVRYNVLRSGHNYDEEWNYTFSKGIPLLTQSQSAVWFYVKDSKIMAIDVW